MRALHLTEYSGPSGLRLGTHELAERTDDLVQIEVRAVGINYPDLLLTQGRYQLRPPLPAVPGCEIAGVVQEASASSGYAAGDRVAAFTWQGGYAEQALVPVSHLMRILSSMSFGGAAATVVNYHTVLFALQRRGSIRVGDRVLVMGSGGGIGTAALQVAAGLGAVVIAGVADDSQVETVRRAAPDATAVVLREGFAADVRDATGGLGVDIVVDPVGDWLFGEAVRALAPEGRVVVIGFAAGSIPTIAVNRLLLKNVGVIGAAFGAFLESDPALMDVQNTQLSQLITDGSVRPHIGQKYDFDAIPTALDDLAAGRIRGKGVALISSTDITTEELACANAL